MSEETYVLGGRPIYKDQHDNRTWSIGRDKTDYESRTSILCPICNIRSDIKSTHYSRKFGGAICNNCSEDLKKTPCSDCFTIHAGECY